MVQQADVTFRALRLPTFPFNTIPRYRVATSANVSVVRGKNRVLTGSNHGFTRRATPG